jgi:major membrane immunogen (membrane-anchored lipoprotein)
MTKKITMAFMTAALMVASAAEKHNLTLFQPSFVNGTELAPGDYRMELDGDKVVISKGKNKVEANVKVDTADAKFSSTSVRYANADGKYKVQEIRLGGTNRKLVFAGAQTGM